MSSKLLPGQWAELGSSGQTEVQKVEAETVCAGSEFPTITPAEPRGGRRRGRGRFCYLSPVSFVFDKRSFVPLLSTSLLEVLNRLTKNQDHVKQMCLDVLFTEINEAKLPKPLLFISLFLSRKWK